MHIERKKLRRSRRILKLFRWI